MNIWILSDTKPGHLSQTKGLAAALVKRCPGTVEIVELAGKGFCQKIREATSIQGREHPDLILAAGHSTHIPLLFAARQFKAISIVCMKPTLPVWMFDLCIIPRHDLPEGQSANKHIFSTTGALHSIRPCPNATKDRTLFLIGGPSKAFSWDADDLLGQIQMIETRITGGQAILTTSRRTPQGFAEVLVAQCPHIQIEPVEQTPPGWVADQLKHAHTVWVTQDSVSMVYESLASGAAVGLLSMPKRPGKSTRVARGIEMLIAEGRVTPWAIWRDNGHLKSSPPLVETERAAQFIIQTFFSNIPQTA